MLLYRGTAVIASCGAFSVSGPACSPPPPHAACLSLGVSFLSAQNLVLYPRFRLLVPCSLPSHFFGSFVSARSHPGRVLAPYSFERTLSLPLTLARTTCS